MSSNSRYEVKKEPKLKSPMTAFCLSLLMGGIGLMWLGKWGKGSLITVFGIILSVALLYSIEIITYTVIMVVFWIIQALYAFQQARKYNEQKSNEYFKDIDREGTHNPVSTKLSMEYIYCINCGTQLPREAKYCSSCGQTVAS